LAQIGQQLGRRQAYIKHGIHNFSLLAQELGARDTQLARFVRSSNDVFQVFADQQSNLRATLALLPGALDATNNAVIASDQLTSQMGPALHKLEPTAIGTAPSLKSLQAFAIATTPVVENQLRPFTAEAGPTIAALKPAAADLAATAPQLDTTFSVLNTLTNELAYNPPGQQEGNLFWLAWGNHLSASMLSAQDAHGPLRRGTLFGSCDALTLFEGIGRSNPEVGTLIQLLNAPKTSAVCGGASASSAVARGNELARQTVAKERQRYGITAPAKSVKPAVPTSTTTGTSAQPLLTNPAAPAAPTAPGGGAR